MLDHYKREGAHFAAVLLVLVALSGLIPLSPAVFLLFLPYLTPLFPGLFILLAIAIPITGYIAIAFGLWHGKVWALVALLVVILLLIFLRSGLVIGADPFLYS